MKMYRLIFKVILLMSVLSYTLYTQINDIGKNESLNNIGSKYQKNYLKLPLINRFNSNKLDQNNLSGVSKFNLSEYDAIKSREKSIVKLIDYIYYETQKIKDDRTYKILSDISGNFQVAGLSGRNAIIDFSPHFDVKFSGSVSLSAYQNFKCFIPVSQIKEQVPLLCLQGLYTVAADKLMAHFFGTNFILSSIMGYVAKNIFSSIILKIISNNGSGIYMDRNVNYNLKIKL